VLFVLCKLANMELICWNPESLFKSYYGNSLCGRSRWGLGGDLEKCHELLSQLEPTGI
jgi:hypothetical protein